MKLFRARNVLRVGVLALLVVLSLPFDAMGQGRGRRVGHDLSKKCGKFVNCHDARDGRWDGRGPRRASLLDRLRMRNRRQRRFDDDRFRSIRRDRVVRVYGRDRRGRRH
jgi:hypothetical protein